MPGIVSVLDFGATGDGFHDDYQAIQSALHSGAREVRIPIGTYNVSDTLTVPSNVKVVADKCAHLLLRGKKRKHRGDFLLSNEGNENIEIVGGIWNGCCMKVDKDIKSLFTYISKRYYKRKCGTILQQHTLFYFREKRDKIIKTLSNGRF